MTKKKLPPVRCKLVGEDGNAFAILGRWQRAAGRAGWPDEDIQRVLDDARSSDYNHLLYVISKNCQEPEEEEDS